MKLYVGNLPWTMTNADLESLFGTIGPVTSATVITDRDSGQSRGFGFIEMDRADAQRAISELNGREVNARVLKVNEANDKPRRTGSY